MCNCMVNAMEGEGRLSDRLWDMWWSGLGIRGQARKLRLWFIKCERDVLQKKVQFLIQNSGFCLGIEPRYRACQSTAPKLAHTQPMH